MGLEISTSLTEGATVMSVDGRIDASTAPQLEEELNKVIQQGRESILLNFAEVSYISSGGLRVLLKTTKELHKNNGSLILCSLNTDVHKVFKLAGFTSIFKIYSSEEEALAAT